MPDFASPFWLLALPPVLLAAWLWFRRRRPALRFSDLRLLSDLPPGRAGRIRPLAAVGRGLALACLVLALAGLRWPESGSRIETAGIGIVMALDVSGSMAEKDFTWDASQVSRLEAAARALSRFIAGGETDDGLPIQPRSSDLIGLVTFGKRPETSCPLTLSHGVLLKLLDEAKPLSAPDESQTNIGDAVAWALHRLAGAAVQRKIVILLSDGEHNEPPPALKPRQAAQLAANLGVPVYCIDAGGAAREESPEAEYGRQTLRVVATLTGGEYFQARDASALLHACQRIDTLERDKILSFLYRRYYDAHGILCLVALGLMACILIFEKTWWRVLP